MKNPVQINNSDKQYEVAGKLGKKLGTMLTVRGIVVEGDDKGYEDGPNLIVQVINDSSTQHLIQIPISPYLGHFSGKISAFKNGATYLFRVYETGEFVGVPSDAYREAGIISQTTDFYFSNRLIVISGEKIAPIKLSPIDFIGQKALLSGMAKNESDTALIEFSKWKLRLIGFRKWTASEIGKPSEVYGKIKETKVNGEYEVEVERAHLIRLQDQVGKMVTLRGEAVSLNGHWWLNYRSTDLYVEKMEELPNWTANNHFRPIEITGTLEQSMLPRLDQIGIKTNPDRKLYYIIRKASWNPIDELLTPELH